MVKAAISGMLATLDKYSVFLDGDEYNSIRDETKGEFGGIGIEVSKGDGFIEVVTPLDGTPGEMAGLEAGDRITHADGFSLAELSFRDVVHRLRGRVGTQITLTIDRDGVQPFETTVIRAIIKIEVVRWRLEEKIGYIRITSFNAHTGSELQKAVGGIRKELVKASSASLSIYEIIQAGSLISRSKSATRCSTKDKSFQLADATTKIAIPRRSAISFGVCLLSYW